MSIPKSKEIGENLDGKILNYFDEMYQLWNETPVLVQLEDDGAKLQHPVLTAILKVLRVGIPDQDGRKRHYLTVNELLDQLSIELKNQVDKPVKKSMLYYYLDILQEMKLLEYVYYIEGRHKRKYFGRTGKFFIFGDEAQEKEKKRMFIQSFIKFLSLKNKEISEEEIMSISEDLVDRISKASNDVLELIKSNEKLMLEHDIDAWDLYSSFSFLLPFLIDPNDVGPFTNLLKNVFET